MELFQHWCQGLHSYNYCFERSDKNIILTDYQWPPEVMRTRKWVVIFSSSHLLTMINIVSWVFFNQLLKEDDDSSIVKKNKQRNKETQAEWNRCGLFRHLYWIVCKRKGVKNSPLIGTISRIGNQVDFLKKELRHKRKGWFSVTVGFCIKRRYRELYYGWLSATTWSYADD